MESLWILIPLSLLIAVGIGAVFWWAVNGGQMDDLDSPARRILIDDDRAPVAATQADVVFPTATNADLPAPTPPSNKVLPVV